MQAVSIQRCLPACMIGSFLMVVYLHTFNGYLLGEREREVQETTFITSSLLAVGWEGAANHRKLINKGNEQSGRYCGVRGRSKDC